MAQGQIKKKAASSAKSGRSTSSGVTRKGLGVKNPRKDKLIKAQKINKKFTAGLTAQTERMLGERAGHLEMLGQGKKKTSSVEKGTHGKKGGEKRTGKSG